MSWVDCQLGDVLTLKRGYDLPARQRKEGPVPVVSSSGITGCHNEAKVQGPAVVTGRYGTLGNVYYVDRDCWPLNTALYVVDFKETLPRFAAYFLRNTLRDFKSDKAAVPGVDRNVLHRFDVRVPDSSAQKAIASILSAYDDLIQNNHRRIELLERAARLLYKEWFVDLRFPGHDETTITNGVPEGWEEHRINDVCDTVGGGTPSTKVSEYWNGNITWIVPSDVTKTDCLVLLDSKRKITERGLRSSSARMVPAHTILMTSRASVGYFALVTSEVCTNQGFINIVSHDDHNRLYLLFNLMSRVHEIRNNAKGTTYAEISKGRFRQMQVVLPPATLARRFADMVGSNVKQIGCLARSNHLLAQGRDLLLPRLMNGEIPV